MAWIWKSRSDPPGAALQISKTTHSLGRMVVLDTNVISELMRPVPDPGVKRWFAGLADEAVATTAVTIAELKAGIAFLPDGHRKANLLSALGRVMQTGTGLPVLAFNEAAANVYADLALARRRAGLHIDIADLMIGAVCSVARGRLATRNVADFDGTGLRVVDPWNG